MKELFRRGNHKGESSVRTMPLEGRSAGNRVAYTWNQVANSNEDAMAELANNMRGGLLRIVKFAKSITGGRSHNQG